MPWFKRSTAIFLSVIFFSTYSFALGVGDTAPDFALQGSDGKTHQLSHYLGKNVVVVAWFPRAFTPGCTIECKSFTEHGYLLDEMDVKYFMASTDSLDDVTKFAESMDARFPILSDHNKEAARAYGVLSYGSFSSRVTHYIGLDGKVLFVDSKVSPATSAQDIVTRLSNLSK